MHRFLYFLAIIPLLSASKYQYEHNDHFKEYACFLEVNKHLGELGNYKKGQIEVIVDPKMVKKIEEHQAKKFMKAGESRMDAYEHAKTGIVAKDRYWVWLRDAVIYPSGATGTYNRLVKAGEEGCSGNDTFAVFPVTKDKKIILNITYRHAIRDWVLELPRGSIKQKEDIAITAKRGLKEKTGMLASEVSYLGEIIPYSGTIGYLIPIYYAKIEGKSYVAQDYTEAILASVSASMEEIQKAIVDGYMEVEVENKKMKVCLKDSFLLSALVFAQQKKLI